MDKYLQFPKYLVKAMDKNQSRGGYCNLCDLYYWNIKTHLLVSHCLDYTDIKKYCKIFKKSIYFMPNIFKKYQIMQENNSEFAECLINQENIYNSVILLGADIVINKYQITEERILDAFMYSSNFSIELKKKLGYLQKFLDPKLLKLSSFFFKFMNKNEKQGGYCNICGCYFYRFKSHLYQMHFMNTENVEDFLKMFPELRYYMTITNIKDSSSDKKAIINVCNRFTNSEGTFEVIECVKCKGSGKRPNKQKKIALIDH